MSSKGGNTVQAFWVVIGSTMGFAFSIVSSMILSRYLDKNEYGTFKQILYVYNSLLIVFTLGLPKAYSYFLPRVDLDEAKDLISKINKILIYLGLLLSFFIFFFSFEISNVLDNKDLHRPLQFFSLVPFFMLPTMGVEGILATYKKTKFLALYNTTTKFVLLLSVVTPVVFFNGGIESAVIGFTFASFFCFVFAVYLKNYPVRAYGNKKSNYKIKDIFRFTLPLMGASLWGVLISSSDQFFISRYFGSEVFADFANGSLELPFVSMIIGATSTVLFPVFSGYVHENGIEAKNDVLKLWNSVIEKTIKLTYPLILFSIFFADTIMLVLYGEKYLDSGVFFKIKLLVNFFTVIAYGPLLLSIGGEKHYFKIHMYGAIILVFLEFTAVKIGLSAIYITWISVICQLGRIFSMLFFVSSYFKIKIHQLFPSKLMVELIVANVIILFLIKLGINYLIVDFDNIVKLVIGLSIHLFSFLVWSEYRGYNYRLIFKPLLNRIYK